MSNDKKIVIKINYQNKDGEVSKAETNKLEYVTEWNIKRIGSVMVVLFLLVALAVYFWVSGEEDADKNVSVPALPPAVISPVIPDTDSGNDDSIPDKASSDAKLPDSSVAASTSQEAAKALQDKVVRAALVKSINNNEPSGNISLPLVLGKNGKRTLYYFTEIKDMAGSVVYHEWLYKGASVFKRPIKITGQRWRTATHKIVRSNALGDWSVRLTDEHGNIMHRIDFKVIADNNE